MQGQYLHDNVQHERHIQQSHSASVSSVTHTQTKQKLVLKRFSHSHFKMFDKEVKALKLFQTKEQKELYVLSTKRDDRNAEILMPWLGQDLEKSLVIYGKQTR